MFDITRLYHYALCHLYKGRGNNSWSDFSAIQNAQIHSYDLYEFYHFNKKVAKITQESYQDPTLEGRPTQNIIYLVSSPLGFRAYRMVYTDLGFEYALVYQNEQTFLLKEFDRGSIVVETLKNGMTDACEKYTYRKGCNQGYFLLKGKISRFIPDQNTADVLRLYEEYGLEQMLLNNLEQNKKYVK